MADIDEEFDALRSADFDARGFLKKFMATEDYEYVQKTAPGVFSERRDEQDRELQQLVLDHLSVFVQCKDAIEDVYNSDKTLFTGAAMKEIVEVFLEFREDTIEPLFAPMLAMDSETGGTRNVMRVAQRHGTVLDLPFNAVRAACQAGDFDEAVQQLRSAVSFIDSSRFQRYSAMQSSRAAKAVAVAAAGRGPSTTPTCGAIARATPAPRTTTTTTTPAPPPRRRPSAAAPATPRRRRSTHSKLCTACSPRG